MKFKKSIAIMIITVLSIVQSSTVFAAVPAIETVLNNAALTPFELHAERDYYLYRPDACLLEHSYASYCEDKVIDAYAAAILSAITTPEMTTYQKVKACYDWIIATYEYGDMDPGFDYMDCYGYTDAFVYLTRKIGLESYFVHGSTYSSTRGYTNHGWAVIVIDGTEYVFDPQIEDNIAKNGAPVKYYRFGKTYEEVPGKYIVCDTNCIPNCYATMTVIEYTGTYD